MGLKYKMYCRVGGQLVNLEGDTAISKKLGTFAIEQ